MTNDEMKRVLEMVNQCREVLDKPKLTSAAQDVYVRVLVDHEFRRVHDALSAHIADPESGKWSPTPSHIIAQMEKRNPEPQWPSADEAWAIAQTAMHEDQSLVWTDEIAQAWGIAREVMPDRTGARMAFKAAYDRLIAETKAKGCPPKWIVSPGSDVRLRAQALEQAVQMQRITHDHAQKFLPPPELTKEEKSSAAVAQKYIAELRAKLSMGNKS